MTVRRKRLAALAIFLTAVLTAVGVIRTKVAPSLESLTIARTKVPGYALLLIAEKRGFFARENLNVTFLPFRTGRDALEALLDQRVDLATLYPTPFVLKAAEGHPLRILSALHRSDRSTGLVARRDRGISEPADLAGKTIGLTFDTNAMYLISLLLLGNGLDPKSVKLVDIAPNEIVGALARGTVDAIATWQPELGKAQGVVERTVTFYSDDYTELSMLVGRVGVATSRGEAVHRLFRALVSAEKYLKEFPVPSREMVAASFAPEEQAMVRATWNESRYELKLDHFLLITLEREAEIFRSEGRISNHYPEFDSLVRDVFLERAAPEAVTLFPGYTNSERRAR